MSPGPAQKYSRCARTRLFGLFAAVWVGLALQPCAVAEVSESDCPHCPTEIEHVATLDAHCDPIVKVTPEELPNCDSVQAECCDLDRGVVNARADATDADDEPIGLVTSFPSSLHNSAPCEDPGGNIAPPEPSGASVPLHILKCAYLK